MFYHQTNQAPADLPATLRFNPGFAEPDWRGDADFDGRLDPVDLDSVIAGLAAQIEDGARRGWLDAYYARRAAFDLQSIRGQISQVRGGREDDSSDADFRAVLSRVDRLARLLSAARSVD